MPESGSDEEASAVVSCSAVDFDSLLIAGFLLDYNGHIGSRSVFVHVVDNQYIHGHDYSDGGDHYHHIGVGAIGVDFGDWYPGGDRPEHRWRPCGDNALWKYGDVVAWNAANRSGSCS